MARKTLSVVICSLSEQRRLIELLFYRLISEFSLWLKLNNHLSLSSYVRILPQNSSKLLIGYLHLATPNHIHVLTPWDLTRLCNHEVFLTESVFNQDDFQISLRKQNKTPFFWIFSALASFTFLTTLFKICCINWPRLREASWRIDY